ncbi:hypothetical protein Py17XNL_000704175 [Plasmodium yoelii yoelii]|uniref:Uncharacterized protein n=2 Tax=Plasmodium yoelii TaxID=5861 RepID=A0AAE9WPY0_PLAYO|nr:hypothetical protein Py17XNL_000704175 [Plasmodium yoelii yoelii]
MSYLLDDKKLVLKNLISKNEAIKRENIHIELENKAFLCLIEKYGEKKKILKVIEYIHYVCTMLYKNEEDLNFINNDDNFLKTLEKLINNSILRPKIICKNILESNKDPLLDNSVALDSHHHFEKTTIQPGQEKGQPDQEKGHAKNPIYDVNINDIISLKSKINNHAENAENVDNAENDENAENAENVDKLSKDSKENIKAVDVDSLNRDKENEVETKEDIYLRKEKNICLHWSEESSTDNFVYSEERDISPKNNITELNLMGKQQLIFNEIEKIKSEIKELTLYLENTKIIVNSVICQCKIFLFDINDEIKNYKNMKENIKKNNFLLKKLNTINEFYNNIMNKQKKKIEESQKTNNTLINLYKKKFINIKYILSNNKDINTVDFLYLHVLIRNKKINYDHLMRTHENDYAHLRKLINDINAIDNELSENEKKEKEILANLEKNNAILTEMDLLIISLTNKINKINKSSNK